LTARGIRYEGEIKRVNLGTKKISVLLGSGNTVTVSFGDLMVSDILEWCGKKKVLTPWGKGLYAYYNNDAKTAQRFLELSEGFEDAERFLEQIRKQYEAAEELNVAAGRELLKHLHGARKALNEGDWKKCLELLNDSKKRFRSASAWTGTMGQREALRVEAIALKKSAEQKARIERFFSVPVEIRERGALKVEWSFVHGDEIRDFSARGPAWKIADGSLTCGDGQSGGDLDYYHNLVGVRFGEQFDSEKPVTVSFLYRPPVTGEGPVFAGISFFGGCFGIRSFPEGPWVGQVNYWQGDLDEYSDSFFVPALGEERPRKGKIQSFTFHRGERYRIQIHWHPGKELVLKVDESDLYRARSFKPTSEGIEFKTVKQATIEKITIEGALRSDI
jgi:hypothetical protein